MAGPFDSFQDDDEEGDAPSSDQVIQPVASAPATDSYGRQAPSDQAAVAKSMAKVWKDRGWSDASIHGAIANVLDESNLNSSVTGPSGEKFAFQFNPTSHLQPYLAFAKSIGADPSNPKVQADYVGEVVDRTMPGYGKSADPYRATDQFMTGFERPADQTPGRRFGNVSRAQSLTADLYRNQGQTSDQGAPGAVRLAANTTSPTSFTDAGPGTQTGQAPSYDWSALANKRGLPIPSAPQPAAPNAPAPPPGTGDDGYDWSALARRRSPLTATNPTNPQVYGGSPSPGAWNDLKSWFATAPKAVARGLAERFGFVGDVFNASSDFYAQHPYEAVQLGSSDMGMVNPALQTPEMQAALPPQPGATGPHIPITTQNIRTLGGLVSPSWTAKPEEEGDTSTGRNMLFEAGRWIGAGISPSGIVGSVVKGAPKSIGSVLEHNVILPGLGGTLNQEIQEQLGVKGGTPEAAATAAIAAPTILGGRAALFNGILPAAVSVGRKVAPGVYDRYIAKTIGGKLGPGPVLQSYADNPAEAAANLDRPQAGLPEGFQVPAATRTMDEPIQRLYQDLAQKDQTSNAQYRDLLSGNVKAIDLAAEGVPGSPEHTAQYLSNLNNAGRELVQQRLSQSLRDADIAEEAARQDSSGTPLLIGAPAKQNLFNKSQEVVDQIPAARDDTAAYADDAWDVARQGGFTTAKTSTSPIYDGIENLMSRSIQNHQTPQDFPWAEVSPLYKSDPRAMFDAYGNRLPGTARNVEGVNHGNALLPSDTTLEDLKTVDSNLARAIRSEQNSITTPGAGGNPSRLANLSAARGIVWNQIEQGALQNGNYASLRAAMDATKLLHSTYDTGVVGKILNTDVQGQSMVDPGAALRQYLGNGERAIGNARAILDTVDQRTGMAAARDQFMPGNFDPQAPGGAVPAGTHPADQFRNSIADWLRQDFLQTRAEGGQAGARRWLDNHSEFFGQTDPSGPFPRLKSELEGLTNADEAAWQMKNIYAPRSLDEIQRSQAQLYLEGDPGLKIEAALRGQDPYTGMKNLISTVKQDPTGQAFNGLTRDMLDRTLVAARVLDGSRGNYFYSGRAAGKFLQQYKGAFDAIREADPVAGGNLQKIINALDATDQIMRKPGALSMSNDASLMSLSTLGRVFAQIGGAKLAEAVLPRAGPMQAPAIGSAFGAKFYNGVLKRIDQKSFEQVLTDAMYDSDKLKALLAPANTPEAQAAAAKVLSPYVKILPPNVTATGVELSQPLFNPQPQGPQTRPDNRIIGGPQLPGYQQRRALSTPPAGPGPSPSPGSWVSTPPSFTPAGAGPIGSAFTR